MRLTKFFFFAKRFCILYFFSKKKKKNSISETARKMKQNICVIRKHVSMGHAQIVVGVLNLKAVL